MMVPNNFSINIARVRGAGTKPAFAHFAKVELGQMLEAEAKTKFSEFCDRFPLEDGFSLRLDCIECSGRTIAVNCAKGFSLDGK